MSDLKSIKDVLTFKWNVDDTILTRMEKLACLEYSDFLDLLWSTNEKSDKSMDTDKWYNDPQEYFNRFKLWLTNIINSDIRKTNTYREEFKYAYGKRSGRIYTKGFGFGQLHSKIRNYLFNDLDYYDFDIRNCHFNILNHLVKTNNIQHTPYLTSYCNDRQWCLDTWKVDKKDVLRMLNKDTFKATKENGFLVEFHQELKPIKEKLIKIYRHIYKKTNNTTNPISSLMVNILCFFENKILQKTMKHFKNACIPFFDGYIGDKYINPLDMDKLTKDFGLTWTIKPFNDEISNVVDEIATPEKLLQVRDDKLIKANEFFDFLRDSDQTEFAIYFVENNPDIYYHEGEGQSQKWYYYDDKNIIHECYGAGSPTVLPLHVYKFYKDLIDKHFKVIEEKYKGTAEYDDKKKMYIKLKKQFGSSNFKACMIKEMKCYFHTTDKLNLLIDKNPSLLSFKDGSCFDFKHKCVRKIEKQDYVSTTLEYNYPKLNPEVRDDLENFLWSLFEDEEKIQYVKDLLGYSICDSNIQYFHVWTGKGGNGKSLLLHLVNMAFGHYYYSAEQTFLEKSRFKSTHDSSLANFKGKKIVSVVEPDRSSKFDIEKIKALTGDKFITARDVGQKTERFANNATLICACNDIPDIERLDNSTKRRFKVLDFPMRFTAEPTLPNDRKMNINLINKFSRPQYYEQLMLLLIENILPKIGHELVIPKSVNMITDSYIEENDTIMNFINAHYDITQDKHDKVQLNDLYASFKDSDFTDGDTTKLKFRKMMINSGFKILRKTMRNKHTKKAYTFTGFIYLKEKNCDDIEDNDSQDDLDYI